MVGNFLSGRRRTANIGSIESLHRLDMRVLKTMGFLKPGAVCTGTVGWTRQGQTSGEVTLTVDLRFPDQPRAIISYSLSGRPIVQRVVMEAVPCGFGGQRYYFHCPTTGKRCLVLARIGDVFASRQAHRLTYRSQSVGELDRLMDARDTARNRLDGRNGFPATTGKKRMRLWDKWMEAEDAYNEMFVSESIRRFGFEI